MTHCATSDPAGPRPDDRQSPASQTATTAFPKERVQADLLLLLVAFVWGSAFVAQRLGMDQVGPFAFNTARFAVGSLTLIPVLGYRRLRRFTGGELRGGLVLGAILFIAASLQQFGLVWTTAGKAGFITGLYLVIVPLLLALVWREWVRWMSWLGAAFATLGLFLLSLQTGFTLAPGDRWVLAGAVVWALHVIAVGRLAPDRDPLRLALIQYAVCSLLSLPASLLLEPGTWFGVVVAAPAVLYTGVLSIGLGYTGQIMAQRHASPTHAALVLSLESAFAALAGWLALGEALSLQQMVGCGLMLAGMVLAQIARPAPVRA